MERMARVAQPLRWPIQFFSQLPTIARFAVPQRMECLALRCPPLRRARVECSPTNSSMHSWKESDPGQNQTPPSYVTQALGNPQRGADAYQTYCSSCHGVDGRGGDKASSIVDGSFLALVSDQELRTIVITGRPELGAPDWRGDVEGRPMSAQDISDVVAWLSSQRSTFPGQPYPISSMNPAQGRPR
jgi:mono/diheme cytochrome c family protein